MHIRSIVVLAFCLALVSPVAAFARHRAATEAEPGATNEPPGSVINIQAGNSSTQIVVPLDKSQVVRFDRPFREINVGSKDVAAVVPLSRMTAVVIGKKLGTTNLTLTDAGGRVIAVIDVAVTYDVTGLQRRIHDLMPEENIDIQPAGDKLTLTGHVASSDHLHQIAEIADGFAPGKVTNLLSIGGSQQVLLEVRFTEISRGALRDLGVTNKLDLFKVGNGNSITGTSSSPLENAFGTLTGVFTGANFELDVQIDALEKKGLLRTLAEPNIVALSGQTASFLAGGEFPIPVAQQASAQGNQNGSNLITVEFKDFGVGLGFTPTVIGLNLVNLNLSTEVSSIDPTLSVPIGGSNVVPGLKVRRARTTVELHDGETFAIAGLLQDDFQDTLNQVPGLGNLPIIGALFRSTDFQHNQTELAVFITVHLVQPRVAKDLAAPTDTTHAPSTLGLFGLGQTEEKTPPKPQSAMPHGDVLP